MYILVHVLPLQIQLYQLMCQGRKAVLMDGKVFLLLLSVRRSQLVYTMASNSGVYGARLVYI